MPTWCAGILGTRPPFLPLLITSQVAGPGECGYRTFSAMETRAVSSTVRTLDGGSVQGVDLGTGTDLPELSAQVSIRYSTFVNEHMCYLRMYVQTCCIHVHIHPHMHALTHMYTYRERDMHVHIHPHMHALTHMNTYRERDMHIRAQHMHSLHIYLTTC